MLDMYIPERYLRLPMLKRNRIDKKNVIKIFIDCLIPFVWSIYFALWENGKMIIDYTAVSHFIVFLGTAVLMVLSWRIIEKLISDVISRMYVKAGTIFIWILLIVLLRN